LATGGFAGNPEMLTRYLGRRAKFLRQIAPGGYYNKGEGIDMALDVGAAPAGEYSLFHAEPIDPRSRQAEAVVFIYTHGILVNRQGQRFVDEAAGFPDQHYENVCHCITDQDDGIAYAIFDSAIDDVPNWRKSVRSDQKPFSADSIAALAKLIGVSAEELEKTVSSYNAACGNGTFSPLALDGLSTTGVVPRKSNWARPIEKPPFHAYPVIAAIVFTFGGLKIDARGRVLDGDGRPIPGLYSAGEATGFYHKSYTGATSVMRGAVFGRAAGMAAAAALASRHD
jgi:tricarballylate dehydrogenase